MLIRGRRIHGRKKKSNTLPYHPSILHFSEIPTSTLPKLAGWEQYIAVGLYSLSSHFDELKREQYNEIRCYYFRSMKKDN